MKKICFLCLLFGGFLINLNTFGQCNQDITLSSQQDVDNFMTDFGCTEIDGNLTILGDDITDLSGLSGITSINADFFIGVSGSSANNPSLINIDGLSNLTSIQGNLSIIDNASLTNIDGLSSLTTIGDIIILFNQTLTNIDGLNNLTSIEGSFFLQYNYALTNINGLNNLTSIEKYFSIYSNAALTNINGFGSLSSIGNYLHVHNNDALTNINGFGSLSSIGNYLIIENNDALINIDGLSSLVSIESYFTIENNDALINIDGLSNLISIGYYLWLNDNEALTNINGLSSLSSVGDQLRIGYNESLMNIDGLSSLSSVEDRIWINYNESLMSIDGLSSLTSIGDDLRINQNMSLNSCCIAPYLASITQGEVTIENNAPGCNSLEEISNLCSDFKITAQPFYDQNENGILDTEEQTLYNLPFTINPEALFSFYDENGTLKFFVEPNTYTLQYDNTNNGLWQVNGNDSYTVEMTDAIDTTFYFPMLPVTDFIIQDVDVTSSITRCNQSTNLWLTYTNKSSEPTSGYVHVIANELATFESAIPPVDSIAGDTLFWFYEDLYPTHSEQIHLIYQIAGVGEDGENLGENITFDAQMETWDGEGENKDLLLSELVCAYDPNDKLVTPSGVGEENYTLFEDSLLHYTIRFQNTGNDTAFQVTILDTIQNYLDISTFQFIASSHDVGIKIDENTKIIEFLFEDIYLPDSNVNEPASHGFVKFSMETNSNLEENTLIENTANIFFDFNPAIVTNTTTNTMVSEIPTETGQCDQDITLSSQEDVNNFMVDYNCTEIGGNLTIDGSDIVDLSSLSAITSIMGNLVIINNVVLTNIDGLSSISSINGDLAIINNDALINIDGLNNLNSIESSISIFNNPILTNIDGLNNITSIENNIAILYNSALTNINGLNSLSSIGGFLQIQYNDILNNCCIVASINAENITIEDNALGCNSLEEITDSCSMTSLQTIKENPSLQIYPNPNTGTFTIESKEPINTLKIYNSIGQLIQENEVNAPSTKVNIPTIQTGIYFVAIETESGVIVEKVLVQ